MRAPLSVAYLVSTIFWVMVDNRLDSLARAPGWVQTILMTQSTTVKAVCSKCDGAGSILGFGHIANGVCFDCKGTGYLLADESTVQVSRRSRAQVIRTIKVNLDRMAENKAEYGCAFAFPDEIMFIADALAHADADVHARAIAALVRLGAEAAQLACVARMEALETAVLVAGVCKVHTNVRAA